MKTHSSETYEAEGLSLAIRVDLSAGERTVLIYDGTGDPYDGSLVLEDDDAEKLFQLLGEALGS